MTTELSKTQIDRLGDRLKEGKISDDDLRLLDQYRLSFSDAYEFVVDKIQSELRLAPTGRPAKSTTAISDKLMRESIRLTQVQDIAGCRLIVQNTDRQDKVFRSLENIFENTRTADRRDKPSHGYRAVHVMVNHPYGTIEIQIRTELQHQWAEVSEKLSDLVDPMIKYGGGEKVLRRILDNLSILISEYESLETDLKKFAERLALRSDSALDLRQKMVQCNELLDAMRITLLEQLMRLSEIATPRKYDLSN